jgi:hypothetical protein
MYSMATNTLEISRITTYIDEGSPASPVSSITKREYYDIMNDIRNMRVLTDIQREQMTKLSRKRLFEIIDVYNLIMRNVNDVLS